MNDTFLPEIIRAKNSKDSFYERSYMCVYVNLIINKTHRYIHAARFAKYKLLASPNKWRL